MSNSNTYDSSWNENNNDLWDEKLEEWEERDWDSWLSKHLTFPFEIERQEDDKFNPFSGNESSDVPFSIDHIMKAIQIEMEDGTYGIILKVRESRKIGYVPLCDVEVTSRDDKNFWPVREYVVWFANR